MPTRSAPRFPQQPVARCGAPNAGSARLRPRLCWRHSCAGANVLQDLRKKHQHDQARYTQFTNSSVRIALQGTRSRAQQQELQNAPHMSVFGDSGSADAGRAASGGTRNKMTPRRRSRCAGCAAAQARASLADFRSSLVWTTRPERSGQPTEAASCRKPVLVWSCRKWWVGDQREASNDADTRIRRHPRGCCGRRRRMKPASSHAWSRQRPGLDQPTRCPHRRPTPGKPGPSGRRSIGITERAGAFGASARSLSRLPSLGAVCLVPAVAAGTSSLADGPISGFGPQYGVGTTRPPAPSS